ncbi:neutral zinc metallopeptidase [Christiangramia sediminis]|uniref:Neutral zinc metallopeptidase n=1 Tax=Christiangramia sediminis TaxID=2881336 RepID=A0A9X1LIC8_9FLAO|nr:neutral zinc metallopeptidase [Christiangramia sediminis]MCB7480885.1 neutral zinc metallopeptidase [Christiangramia sediminis]
MKKTGVYIWCCGVLLLTFITQSCSGEDLIAEDRKKNLFNSQTDLTKKSKNFYSKTEPDTYSLTDRFKDESLLTLPCESTDFGDVLSGYFESLLTDPAFDFDLLNYYLELNRKYVTFYHGENYYGENGEFNKLAEKRIRELTKFWDLNREIRLNGQHNSFLNDREILTDMIESFDRTVRNRTEAYAKADLLLELNKDSPNFPENPYFAFDAFTKSNGLLVIGDGLLEGIMDTGIDGDLAFTAVLAHEWWHQAQFEHEDTWDYTDQLSNPTEISRFSELEADFAAAYYLAHKRGATYNWKRIEEYFRLSFNVGDCLIQSMDHHGTPTQRLSAAELGYELAASAQKKGFILSPSEVHFAFLEVFEDITK